MRNPIKNAVYSLFHNPRHILFALLHRMPWLIRNDKKYLSTLYWLNFGVKPNLSNPKKFSEKIQWLKLYDHNPLYTTLVDKYAVKEYVAQEIGAEYIIPLIATWESPIDINWEALPNQFVVNSKRAAEINAKRVREIYSITTHIHNLNDIYQSL